MDSDSDYVAETDKYAFLLGSAIRVDDTDQFFSIYDSILPRNLPGNQIETIKEKAREISELPEEEFNSLVCQARNFSLAPAGVSMSCPRTSSVPKLSYNYEEEDEGVSSSRITPMHPGRFDESSSCFSTNSVKTSNRSSEPDSHRLEDDSGVYNSSKAASLGSWTDENASDDEREAADFDYFPPQIKISSGRTLYYDEVHEVETESSTEDVNSPRSDIDQKERHYDGEDGVEMVPILSSNDEMPRRSIFQDDFNTSGDSDDDCGGRAFNYYYTRPKTYNYKPKFDSFSHHSLSSSSLSLRKRDVDEKVTFRTLEEGVPTVSRYAPYQEYGSISGHSDRVKVEKTSYKNSPPFGSRDQLNKVANSITPLLSGLSGTEAPTNMPPARELKILKSDDVKKKKKKKKLQDEQVDENGNPVFSKDKYKQMREAPPALIASGKTNRFDSIRSNADASFDLPHRELENESYSRAQEKRKRKKQLSKENEKKSEDIENYVGNKLGIDELIDFIGGKNVGNKKNKKTVTTNPENIPGKTANNKVTKKSKDKDKKKTLTISDDSVEKIGEKAEDLPHINSAGSEESKIMGNSGGKNDYHLAEADSVNDMIIEKDLFKEKFLKENDKKVKKSVINSDDLPVKEFDLEKDNESVNEIKKEPEFPEIHENLHFENDQKKKSDKNGKTQKKDTNDKPKSVEIEKATANASTTTVSVKQKNAKNKKSKASPKAESPTENKMMNIEVTTSVSSIQADGFIDNKFIFTDIDLQSVPKEDEFQVVEKKKKKPVREGTNHFTSAGNNNHGNNNHKASRFSEDKRVSPPANSNKLTASEGSYGSKSAEIDTRLRDLSPSAFPALNSGKGRIQDGRRNSTGDVPILSEIALKAQDDSDIESVKSLPATQGSRVAETIISPRLNMSYAKMAASPKQKGESPDEKTSGFVDNDESERKTAIWKGSPTERRHSIGSSPDAKAGSNTNSNVTSNSVKAGSQEMLNVDPLSNKVISSMPHKDKKSSVVSSKEIKNSVPLKRQDSESAQSSDNAAKIPYSKPVVQNSGVSQKCDVDLTSANLRNSVHTKTKINSEANIIKTSKNILNAKTVNSNKQDRKTKPCSVIFLDRRVAEPTNNLGITFGFECDSSDMTESKIDMEQRDMHSNHTVTQNVTFLSDLEDEILSSEQVSSDSSNADVIKIARESSKDTASKLVHKVVDHVGQLNGIVRTKQDLQQNPTIDNSFTKEAQNKGATTSTESQSLTHQTQCSKKFENEVIVYYGENVTNVAKNFSIPSLTNGPSHYCGKVIFVPEPADRKKGTFNVHDAVAFLTGEWDGTLLCKETENHVKIHTEQGAI